MRPTEKASDMEAPYPTKHTLRNLALGLRIWGMSRVYISIESFWGVSYTLNPKP